VVTTVVSTAVITRAVPAPVVIAIATIETGTCVVVTGAVIVGIRRVAWIVIRRVARVVIRRGIHIVGAGVVITAAKPQTEHNDQQHSTKHGGLLKDPPSEQTD
jgi:hypothetical protein